MDVAVLLLQPAAATSAPCPICETPCTWASLEPGAVSTVPSGHADLGRLETDPPGARRFVCPNAVGWELMKATGARRVRLRRDGSHPGPARGDLVVRPFREGDELGPGWTVDQTGRHAYRIATGDPSEFSLTGVLIAEPST